MMGVRIVFVAYLFLVHAYAFGGDIKVDIVLLPEGSWGQEDRALIEKAAKEALRKLARAEIANCGYRNSFREKKDVLRRKWGNSMPVINKSRHVAITIFKRSLKKGVLGQARVDIAKIDRRRYTIQNLNIDLSQDAIHRHLSSSKKLARQDIWVNVIAHEVAHNMGFSHGTTGTWSEDYPGYFATEIGYCAMTAGKYGSKGV